MKLIAEESIEIQNNISDVFNYVSNMEKFGEWFPDVINIKSENSQNHGIVGKKYLETIRIPFKGENEYTIEVKEVEENAKFVTEGEVPPLLPRMTVNFSEISKTVSKIRWKMESRSKDILFKFMFLPLFRNVMKKRAKQGMLNLKQILDK